MNLSVDNANPTHLNNSKHRFKREAGALLRLSTPIVISQLAQMGMNFTDTVMAGRHGEHSLAGVAIGSSFWVPCFLLLVGVLMAVTPMVAQSWGAGNTRAIRHHVQQGIWLAAVLGLVMLGLLQALGQVLDFKDMEPLARHQAQGYVFAVSFGLPALAFFQVFRGLHEGLHLTRPFMYVSLTAMLINIPLNYLFIYGKLGLPELGGAGCGWATACVLWLELLCMLFLTLKTPKIKSVAWRQHWCRPQRDKQLALLKLGMPIGISLLIESSMFALIALFLAGLGSTVVAGHQVALSFISILFMVPLSLSMAMTIRCGYYLGQQNPAAARYCGLLGLAATLVIAGLFSLIIVLGANDIASIFSSNPLVTALAVKLFFLAAVFQFSDALQVTAAGILRGYKDTRFAFFVVILAYWGVGLPLGYSLGLGGYWQRYTGAEGFWVGFIAGLSVAAALLVWRFHKLSQLTVLQKATEQA